MTKSLTSSGLPEPEFLEEMGGLSVRFRKDIHTMEHLKKIGLNERQIKAAVYVKEKGKITNKGYQEICETSERTASRDLSSLVSTGIFEQIGATGRGTAYILSGRKEDKDATKTPQRRHKGLGGV
jgi:ATP-dependent DNA helicase RecG